MEKLKITFYALLATAVALAIFFAVVKVAAILSIIITGIVIATIVFYVHKFWPRN